jgi:hypothetical protein
MQVFKRPTRLPFSREQLKRHVPFMHSKGVTDGSSIPKSSHVTTGSAPSFVCTLCGAVSSVLRLRAIMENSIRVYECVRVRICANGMLFRWTDR